MFQSDHSRQYQMSLEITIRPFRIIKWMGIALLIALMGFVLIGTILGIQSRNRAEKEAVTCANQGLVERITFTFDGHGASETSTVTIVVVDPLVNGLVVDSMVCEPEPSTDYQMEHRFYQVRMTRPTSTLNRFRVLLRNGTTYTIDSVQCGQNIVGSFPIFGEVAWDCRIQGCRINGVWQPSEGMGIYIRKPKLPDSVVFQLSSRTIENT